MALITLICPHCGGSFELDIQRTLQPFLTCPYCGNRSLMQKNEDNIRLRGILPASARQSANPPDPADVETVQAYSSDPETEEEEAEEEAKEEEVAEKIPTVPAHHLEEMIAEAQLNTPNLHAADQTDAEIAMPEMTPSSPMSPTSPSSPAPVVTAVAAVAATPGAPVIPAVPSAPARPSVVASNPVRAAEEPVKTTIKPAKAGENSEIERLYGLAETAAEKHDLPLFNVYSRKALDCQPEDPRVYAWRAILTEESDGFARDTWTNPGWSLLTPRRKQALLSQHFYNFNTALKFSRPDRQRELIRQIAWQIYRQAIDYFTEQAELRCRQRLFFKSFKGRYRRSDIRSATLFAEAFYLLDRQIIPLCREAFFEAIRDEIRQAPPIIEKKLRRV